MYLGLKLFSGYCIKHERIKRTLKYLEAYKILSQINF